MKKFLILLIAPIYVNMAYALNSNCKNDDIPKVIKPMADWDIIATNTGTIPAASIFSGNKLSYSFSAHPTNRSNIVTIDKKTGTIHVKAEKKDKFDIIVKARNQCGTATNTFNVLIDEEE